MSLSQSQSQEESQEVVKAFTSLVRSRDVAVPVAVPVAAMHALNLSIEGSKASTLMGLIKELTSNAIALLKRCRLDDLGGRTNVSLASGCDLYMNFVRNVTESREFSLHTKDMPFKEYKEQLLLRGKKFVGQYKDVRDKIADFGHSFITDGCTMLVHGNSRVVTALIHRAIKEKKQFNIIFTEGRPGTCGSEAAQEFHREGISTKLILDCAVGTYMDTVDLVLVGAEGVMENGGIVNRTGTYQIAMVARALNKPVYVAVESYKFSREYPLTQRDVYELCAIDDTGTDTAGENDSPIGGGRSASIGSGRTGTRVADDNDANDFGLHTIDEDDISDVIELGGGSLGGAPPLQRNFPLQRQGSIELQRNNSSSIKFFDSAMPPSPSGKNNGSNASQAQELDQKRPFEHMLIDFTPAEFITLLFTDLGVLTPAAVSDELIRLYQ